MADDAEDQKPEATKKPAVVNTGAMSAAGTHAVVVARPAPPAGVGLPQVSRRKVMITGFWSAMALTLGGIVYTIINNLWPRGIQKFGGKFTLDIKATDIEPGEKRDIVVLIPNPRSPLENLEAKVYLVRFNAEQAARNPGAQEGALLALWRKCPHLGCTVPFNEQFSFLDPLSGQTNQGWFRCPCHGSTYSDSGRRVFGPAPRSMDVFPLEIAADGTMTITLEEIKGSPDNGKYAQLPPA